MEKSESQSRALTTVPLDSYFLPYPANYLPSWIWPSARYGAMERKEESYKKRAAAVRVNKHARRNVFNDEVNAVKGGKSKQTGLGGGDGKREERLLRKRRKITGETGRS